MLVQNNYWPWVVLILIVLVACGLLGMAVGQVGPFNPQLIEASVENQKTQGAVNAAGTQAAWIAAATAREPHLEQTRIVSELTALPLRVTATAAAETFAHQFRQAAATQTAEEREAVLAEQAAGATQTALVGAGRATETALKELVTRERTDTIVSIVVPLGGICIVGALAGGWVIVRTLNARKEEAREQAQLLAEQRRTAALNASLERKKSPGQQAGAFFEKGEDGGIDLMIR